MSYFNLINVCSFSGKPARMYDQANPDWIPTLENVTGIVAIKVYDKTKNKLTDNER